MIGGKSKIVGDDLNQDPVKSQDCRSHSLSMNMCITATPAYEKTGQTFEEEMVATKNIVISVFGNPSWHPKEQVAIEVNTEGKIATKQCEKATQNEHYTRLGFRQCLVSNI